MPLRKAFTPEIAGSLFRDERAIELVRAAWPGAVGPELARRTEPIALRGSTLNVRVADSGWTRVLHRMRGEILGRLREVVGSCAPTRLGFVDGPVTPPPEPAPGMEPPADAPLAAEVAESARLIPDAEIRAGFERAARSYLARARAARRR